MIIETVNLTKKVKSKVILENVNIKINSKGIYGIIGHNGAGKTTLFKLLAGLIRPTNGEIILHDECQEFGHPRTVPLVYLVDVPNQFEWMTVLESMKFYASIVGLTKEVAAEKIEYYLNYVELKDYTKKVGKLSRGMRQKLGIAQALLSNADIFLLDEPTSALEPAARKEVLELLQKVSHEKTICVSSHILHDLERICDHIILLNQGTVVLQDSKKNVLELYIDNRIQIELFHEEDGEKLCNGLDKILGVDRIEKYTGLRYIVKTQSNDQIRLQILKFIVDQNIDIVSFQPYSVSLEDIYLRKVL